MTPNTPRCSNGTPWSSYLPEKIIEKTVDKRSKCPILRDFRKRLREADQSQVPAFIEEGRSLFKADPPYETSIVVSNAKRRRICEESTKKWKQEHPDVSSRWVSCEDIEGYWLFVSLSVRGRFGSRSLINGMHYICTCLDPIQLREKEIRWGKDDYVTLTVSLETLGRESTLTCASTAASIQGDTCESGCLADLGNTHMQKKDLLEMAVGRATHSKQLRFL